MDHFEIAPYAKLNNFLFKGQNEWYIKLERRWNIYEINFPVHDPILFPPQKRKKKNNVSWVGETCTSLHAFDESCWTSRRPKPFLKMCDVTSIGRPAPALGETNDATSLSCPKSLILSPYIAYNTGCDQLQAGQNSPLTHNGWGQSVQALKKMHKAVLWVGTWGEGGGEWNLRMPGR